MTTVIPERYAPTSRREEGLVIPRKPRQRALRGSIAAGIVLTLALASAAVVPAMATTAPPTMSAGGSGAPGSVSGSSSTSTTRTSVGCPGCDDHDACTNDTCDADYQCIYTPVNCDDGLRCTGDICDPSTGCVHAPMDCSTGSVCVTYSCTEATGACVLVGKKFCADHNACTDDTCDSELGCLHAPILCNDHDRCTQDSCDPRVGCIHRTGACDHGPGHSAPPGAGTEAPSITPDSGDASTAIETPLPSDREVADLRAPLETIDGVFGEAELCALVEGQAAEGIAGLLLVGWPATPIADPALSAAWEARRVSQAALAAGVCGQPSIAGPARRIRTGSPARSAADRSSP